MPIFVRRCLIFSALFTPFAYILAQVVALQMGDYEILGPEPGKAIVWFTGEWAFNALLLTLAVSPARQWLGLKWPLMHRRMLGLFVMFYATLHFLSYTAFLLAWQWQDIGSELVERPYLTLGFLAWVQIRSSWFEPSLYAFITLVLLGQRFSLVKIRGFFTRST
jgi:sulfoxide reductase heme-binding subunit YedZ